MTSVGVGETRPKPSAATQGGNSASRPGEEVLLSGAESACLRHRLRAQLVRR